MLTLATLTSFAITALFFIMTPGLDTIFVLNTSISRGTKSGIYASLGINTGVLVHALLGAIGISALISSSPIAFSIISYAGGCYIIYLGLTRFKKNATFIPVNDASTPPKRGTSNFWSGFVTNTLNPKVALFFIAFFPQYIGTNELQNPLPFLFLGIIYSVLGIIWYVSLTYVAGKVAHKIQEDMRFQRMINKVSGIAFILIGLKIILEHS